MAHRRNIKVNRRTRGVQAAYGRGRAVGLSTAAAVLVAFGVTPLATLAPPARADVVDDVIDQVFAPFIDTAANTVEAAAVTPTAWLSTADLTASLQHSVYLPLHTGIEDWIRSNLGEQVDGFVNTLFGSDVIGNGTAGTAAHPDGGAGGWLFGDGGAGWNSTFAGVVGGDGGAAGIFGNGGSGGDGGEGSAGGDGGPGGWLMGIGGAGGHGGEGSAGVLGGVGGDGGAGGHGNGWLFGVGGNGGNGGDGTDGGNGGNGGDGGDGAGPFGSGGNGGNGGDSGIGGAPAGLPALGGAGGNGGLLGDHGTVGHYGTVTGVAPGANARAPAASTDGLGDLPISTTGTWLTDSSGRVVILHGLNEVYKVAPYEPAADGFGNNDAAFLAANGFDAVRVGILWAGVEPEPGVFNDAYLASIAQTVQTLGKYGIVSVLDMHQDSYASPFQGEGAPEWAVQTGGAPNIHFGWSDDYLLDPAENHAWDAFWSNAQAPNGVGLENDYAQMWEHVANYFDSRPDLKDDVAGFEIMNEPGAGSQELPTILGNPHFGAQELTPFYNQVASAIRAVDPSTPVLFEPTTITEEGLFPTSLGTVDQPHTVFSFHNYCDPIGIDIPCGFTSQLFVNRAEQYSDSHDIPDLMTEFGIPPSDPMQAADQARTGWLEWAYTSQGDITGGGRSESLVYNPHLPPTGDNVNTAHLETLAEPYPQAIAGIPNSYSFDHGTFTLSYSTEMANGSGHFPAGSQTDIAVPAIQYPNGYQVSVTGGHVVSAANAPILVVESDSGASTVDVTVSSAAL